MTVADPGQDTTTVDRAAAEEEFTEIYRTHWTRVRWFIWRRLDLHQDGLADDLAQETFLALWSDYILKDKLRDIDTCLALLYTIARHRITKYFKKVTNSEKAIDFGDQANTPILATGHCYAADVPHLALVGRDLDAALERVTAASELWRAKDKAWHRCRALLSDGRGLLPETKERLEREVIDAEAAESAALQDFRDAALRVGELRAELETAAGPDWRSLTARPVGGAKPPTKAPEGTLADPTVTHCPNGHLMDRANTYFVSNGYRMCRACPNAKRREEREIDPGRQGRKPLIPEELVETARKLIEDPAESRSVVQIAKDLGVSATVLHRRIPNAGKIRRAARGGVRPSTRGIPVELVETARKLIEDPTERRSVQEIAKSLGVHPNVLYRKIPGAGQIRRAALGGVRASSQCVAPEVVEAVRLLLLDSQEIRRLEDIAKAVGIGVVTVRRYLPNEVACHRDRRRAARQSAVPAGATR